MISRDAREANLMWRDERECTEWLGGQSPSKQRREEEWRTTTTTLATVAWPRRMLVAERDGLEEVVESVRSVTRQAFFQGVLDTMP
jgi:hypothetical protein